MASNHFERVFEDLQKEHPILRLVNFTPTVGLTKQFVLAAKVLPFWSIA